MLRRRFRSKSNWKVELAARSRKYDSMCMMMDGKSAQNTSSNTPENLNFLEKTEERYARLKVMPGRMNKKRKRVDTANATTGGLAQFSYEINLLAETESFAFAINFFIDVN
jgi:hypothetical protein